MKPASVNLRVLLIFLAMALSAWLAYAFKPNVKLADANPLAPLETAIPKQFGAWRVDDNLPVILPSPEVQEKLDKIYNQVNHIMLSIAYGGDQSDGTTAH